MGHMAPGKDSNKLSNSICRSLWMAAGVLEPAEWPGFNGKVGRFLSRLALLAIDKPATIWRQVFAAHSLTKATLDKPAVAHSGSCQFASYKNA